jgi:hypothetical protein
LNKNGQEREDEREVRNGKRAETWNANVTMEKLVFGERRWKENSTHKRTQLDVRRIVKQRQTEHGLMLRYIYIVECHCYILFICASCVALSLFLSSSPVPLQRMQLGAHAAYESGTTNVSGNDPIQLVTHTSNSNSIDNNNNNNNHLYATSGSFSRTASQPTRSSGLSVKTAWLFWLRLCWRLFLVTVSIVAILLVGFCVVLFVNAYNTASREQRTHDEMMEWCTESSLDSTVRRERLASMYCNHAGKVSTIHPVIIAFQRVAADIKQHAPDIYWCSHNACFGKFLLVSGMLYWPALATQVILLVAVVGLFALWFTGRSVCGGVARWRIVRWCCCLTSSSRSRNDSRSNNKRRGVKSRIVVHEAASVATPTGPAVTTNTAAAVEDMVPGSINGQSVLTYTRYIGEGAVNNVERQVSTPSAYVVEGAWDDNQHEHGDSDEEEASDHEEGDSDEERDTNGVRQRRDWA